MRADAGKRTTPVADGLKASPNAVSSIANVRKTRRAVVFARRCVRSAISWALASSDEPLNSGDVGSSFCE